MSSSINVSNINSFDTLLEGFQQDISIKKGSIVKLGIIAIQTGHVLVSRSKNLKSEAVIPIQEFKDESDDLRLEVGTMIDFYVEEIDDSLGQTQLSYTKAKKQILWEKLKVMQANEEIVTGRILERVKGGFTVRIYDSIQGFLPGSLADIKLTQDLDSHLNQDIEFKILKLNQERNNVILSRRLMQDGKLIHNKEELLEKIIEGQQMKGIVKNITEYGAFIDLGGIDGLLHITDISWKRVRHPEDILKVGEEVDVKVLVFDKEKERVSLGIKQLNQDPWAEIEEKLPVESRIFGLVTNITEYGCFVEIETGIEGLVHMSQMDWTNKNINPSTILKVGQKVEVMILAIDKSKRRISLGIKQCTPNPWLQFKQNHQEGSILKAKVKTFSDFGIFVELDGSIFGMVHKKDISYEQSSDNAIKNLKKGDELNVKIMSIDVERERISLSIKDAESELALNFLNQKTIHEEVSGVLVKNDDTLKIELAEGVFALMDKKEWPDSKIGEKIQCFIKSKDLKSSYILVSLSIEKGATKESKKIMDHTFGDMLKEKLEVSSEKIDFKDGKE
jgi:small subunit ribosomal protein S1